MPAASIHGVTLAWSLMGLPFDPLAEILSMLEPAGEGAPSVRFELRPAGPGAAADPQNAGWEPSFFHGGIQAYRGADGLLIWDRASRVLLPLDGGPIVAEIAAPDREAIPGSADTVLQIALAFALRRAGLFHLHAAAVILPSGVPVLIAGGSGAGKTTTTLALVEAGADYLGDDTLFLSAPPGDAAAVDVVAFPREFHIGPATLAAFPRLAPLAGSPARSNKRPLDPRLAFPGRSRASLLLRSGAVALFPSISAAPVTTAVPLARADAFGHLLASSAALVIDGVVGRAENLALLAALLGAVRCYEIRLGSDLLTMGSERGLGGGAPIAIAAVDNVISARIEALMALA
jgi:hypothetical protein